MKTLKLFAIVLISLTSFVGCKKYQEKGDYQPAGNYAGAKSINVSISTDQWINMGDYWSGVLSASNITPDVIKNGAVMVYMETESNHFTPLPLTLTFSSYFSTYDFVMSDYVIKVSKTDSDQVLPDNPGYKTFKIVAISASGLKEHPDVDIKDYVQVKNAFNL